MIPLPTLFSARRLAHAAGAVCLLALPLAAAAEDPMLVPPATPPPGTNPAVFAVPRIDWLEHFEHNLERTRQGHVDLLFDGDSITDWWQNAGKEVWNKNYGQFHPADFGISGDCTQHLLWRLDHGQVAGLHPKLIALMIGTNNIKLSAEQIAEGVTADVRAYQKLCPDSVILLQAIFPRAEKPDDPVRAKIKSVNAIIAKLGDGKQVIYVDFGDKFLQPDGTLSKEIMPDFLHPSAKGYGIWADAIRPEIEKFFGPTPPAK